MTKQSAGFATAFWSCYMQIWRVGYIHLKRDWNLPNLLPTDAENAEANEELSV